ncbi:MULTISPECIES: universal stress protein [Streptomycetaceae]|uniref:universal stress protein n=1 Tax=unclassified Streptomyces TaxID=2593676 RepID=UPI0033827796
MSTAPVDDEGPAHIVVGVDGSDSSARALRWAAQEARLRGARLEVVHAWQFPSVGLPGVSPPYPDEMFAPAARAVVDHAVAGLGAGRVEAGIDRRAVKGHPSAVLVEASEDAALLVVGSHGHGGVAGTLLGSVSRRVAHHARCPVVIVPDPK